MLMMIALNDLSRLLWEGKCAHLGGNGDVRLTLIRLVMHLGISSLLFLHVCFPGKLIQIMSENWDQ